jgi:hypothetical protein
MTDIRVDPPDGSPAPTIEWLYRAIQSFELLEGLLLEKSPTNMRAIKALCSDIEMMCDQRQVSVFAGVSRTRRGLPDVLFGVDEPQWGFIISESYTTRDVLDFLRDTASMMEAVASSKDDTIGETPDLVDDQDFEEEELFFFDSSQEDDDSSIVDGPPLYQGAEEVNPPLPSAETLEEDDQLVVRPAIEPDPDDLSVARISYLSVTNTFSSEPDEEVAPPQWCPADLLSADLPRGGPGVSVDTSRLRKEISESRFRFPSRFTTRCQGQTVPDRGLVIGLLHGLIPCDASIVRRAKVRLRADFFYRLMPVRESHQRCDFSGIS